MLPCISTPQRRTSKELEKRISTWMKDYNKSIKLLLLGAGESGKTTIIKQMKILHIKGFSDEEKQEKALEIRRNVLDSIVTLCQHLARLGLELEESSNGSALTNVLQCGERCSGCASEEDIDNALDQKFFDDVARLWRDGGIQAVYSRQHEFQLIDCAKYFLDQVQTVGNPDYTPTVQDILNSRRMTIDIQKIEFGVQVPKKYGGGQQTFWMFDVGGQKGERKKWIQVFDGIQAVLFLVATNCYDLMVREDEKTNRLEDSLEIFENVWTSRFLLSAGFILFLNKQDKLKEKVMIEKKSIADSFPEYTDYKLASKDDVPGEDPEYLRSRCFIRDQFLEISRIPTGKMLGGRKASIAPGISFGPNSGPQRECYHHFTTATDTDNVKLVFEDVHDMIIMLNLNDIGIH